MRLLALYLVAIGGCVVQSPPAPPPPPPERVEPVPAEPGSRLVQLEDGSYVEIRPGLEAGFAHCCGDAEYMMEAECSEGLLRCYEHTGQRWKQTYGKYCKQALGPECYERGCIGVCEAYWVVGEASWLK